MKKLTMIVPLLVLAASVPAFAADAECEAKFRQLLRGDSGEYPFTARSVTEFAGTKTNSIFTAEGPGAYLTIDERTGLWVLIRDGKAWQSPDKGKSWKFLYDLPQNQDEKVRESLKKRADSAENIACVDGADFQGGSYRRLTGEWKSDDGTPMSGRSEYFLNDDGTWHAAVTEMTVSSGTSKVTQVKLPEDQAMEVPRAE